MKPGWVTPRRRIILTHCEVTTPPCRRIILTHHEVVLEFSRFICVNCLIVTAKPLAPSIRRHHYKSIRGSKKKIRIAACQAGHNGGSRAKSQQPSHQPPSKVKVVLIDSPSVVLIVNWGRRRQSQRTWRTPPPLHRQKEFMPFRPLSLGTFSQNASEVQIALCFPDTWWRQDWSQARVALGPC